MTIKPKEGDAVKVIVVASTLITKAGIGKTTLDELAVDDRAEAKYDKDSMEASRISVSHPRAKHRGFEGTIKSIADPGATSTSFVLTHKKGKESGDVTINVNAHTQYKVPGMKDATLANFKVGDKVTVLAVELHNGWTALHVHLIPGKPAHVQRVGRVEAYVAATTDTPGSITIKSKKGDLSTFVVTTETKIKFKRGATEVTLGAEAAVVARRDPATDKYVAREIVVFGPKGKDNDNHNSNLDLEGDHTIAGHVDGNIKIRNGTLTVNGTVNGNIEQEGSGGVMVSATGRVNGNIEEKDAGNIDVLGTVQGNVEEKGDGDVNVGTTGVVQGNVQEKDAGNVNVLGTVQGNVEEKGDD